jgi:hypothetical protein
VRRRKTNLLAKRLKDEVKRAKKGAKEEAGLIAKQEGEKERREASPIAKRAKEGARLGRRRGRGRRRRRRGRRR